MRTLTPNTRDFLIPGDEYLDQQPGFNLVGRDDELKKLSGILMRKNAHNVLVVGPGGVGCSAICLGLQEAKESENASLDIVGKKIFWLDTDGLFSSGDHGVINESFQKLMGRLSRTGNRDTVLMVEDAKVFIDAAHNNGCSHFINSLMREAKGGRFQVVFEASDEDLDSVLKAHPDMNETFTMMDVQEPPAEALKDIIADTSKGLENHHGIKISEEARATAIELTNKYRVRDMSLSRAQPERSINLIDRALTSYRQTAHTNPPHIFDKKQELKGIERALSGKGDPTLIALDTSVLETKKIELTTTLEELEGEWSNNQLQLRQFAEAQRTGELLLRDLEDKLDEQLEAEKERDSELGQGQEEVPSAKKSFANFSDRIKGGGFGSKEVTRIREKISEAESSIITNREGFEALTAEINSDLELTPAQVLSEFSRLSGIPTDKLNQDERHKLLNLEDTLKDRVFGQDHAMDQLAGAVRVARAGLKDPDKPQTAFLYAGASGVGKTETAKALTEALMDDERALLRFDMSEYMEKHAVAKLIGAPPGYEGYEAGGILTNALRRNPHVTILFDEIEKAHPDVFNVLLQVLDDGRLTDNRGLTVSFSEANILMTTNIGQPNFLNPHMTFEEASEATMSDLEETYRPEFLNRFAGRQNIVFFKALDVPVIERIAKREIGKINDRIGAQGVDLSISMDDETIRAICEDRYDPTIGARGIPGYFEKSVNPAVARTMFEQENPSGVMKVSYDAASGNLSIAPPIANDAQPVATPEALQL